MNAITWRFAMDSYPETKGAETGPCSPWQDFGFIFSAALFGGFGFAVLIWAASRHA